MHNSFPLYHDTCRFLESLFNLHLISFLSYVRIIRLDVQRSGLGLGDLRGVRLESGGNLGGGELLNLLGGTADEGAGVEELVQLGEDRGEEGGAADALEEVVVLAELLDVVGGLVGEDTCGLLAGNVRRA